jgi:hypothetical protein
MRTIAWYATIFWLPLTFMTASFFVRSQSFLKPYPWVLVGLSMITCGLLFGIVVAFLWLLTLASRGTARIGSKVQINPYCTGCNYDLRGTIPMIPSSKLRGTWIGPARCPECGLVWPLIPKELGGQVTIVATGTDADSRGML